MDGTHSFDHCSMTAETLDQLEGTVWERPTYESGLVQTCYRLRSKPIAEFSVEDLRIMIGQNIGLTFLVPLALDYLEANPWASGDMYPGDLLATTIRADFPWSTRSDLRARVLTVINQALKDIPRFEYVMRDGMPNLDVPDEELAGELESDLRRSLDRI